MSYTKTALMFPPGSEQQVALIKMAASPLPRPKKLPIRDDFRSQVVRYVDDVVRETFGDDPLLMRTERGFLAMIMKILLSPEWDDLNQYDMINWIEGKENPLVWTRETFPKMLADHVNAYGGEAIGTLRDDAISNFHKLTKEQKEIAGDRLGWSADLLLEKLEDMTNTYLQFALAIFDWASKIPPAPSAHSFLR